jgi:hypothetical protein
MTNAVPLLQRAVTSIVHRAHPGHTLVGDEAVSFLTQDCLLHGRFSIATGQVTGFPQSGAEAIAELASDMRRRKPALAHGIALPDLAKIVADKILDRFGPATLATPDAAAWTAIEAEVNACFAAMAVPRRHYVPCAILVDRASSFDIGPITFLHAADLSAHARGLRMDAIAEITIGPLLSALRERSASWLAIVEITGCHSSRSAELADLAVDVAIGALQLFVPINYGSPMARITARTTPPWRGSVFLEAGQVHSGIRNMQAGRGLSGECLDKMIADATPLLASAGSSIDVFLSGKGNLRKLRQAWCDAAYWFHEALAEPLATVATTKFETAIEALLRAESSPKSESRILDAIKALAGLGPDDLLTGSTSLTVKAFAKAMVGARSRVLHGTLSTLLGDVAAARNSLMMLARNFLLLFALHLDNFEASARAKDDRDALLAWIDQQRTAAAPPAPNGAPP